ncbi:hypothetical protein [Ligilactobacillus apodemi]|uniref:hypothetical protein n=1 Tax=Ligilactobacillus apodemi TaxID=307126 RepID=UPI00214BEA7D|nr:hypothetical protein [Ligilactobacillus apodemi]MCR1901108.1 hypothetical protein [Ligilactobacillus apodemi]
MAVKVEIDLAIVIRELLIWGILFALPFCFYKLWQKIKSQLSKDDLKWYSIVIGFSLVVIGIIDIFYVFYDVIPNSSESNKLEATANLTTALVTAISVLCAGIGYFYTKRQDKIQEIHAEGEWCRRLFDLEGQGEYKISDLMQLASLIDIVSKKAKH